MRARGCGRRVGWTVAGLVWVAGAGCASGPWPVPAPPASRPPVPVGEGLRAGFGRADITPPIGVPLWGHAFEGQVARGWRHRLYARAMVLEHAGERVAVVTLDVALISPVLLEEVARRVHDDTGIGGDRLFLSATHTHSGPGNFFLARLLNEQGGPRPGYDPAMVDFIADRIAEALLAATRDLATARAAWGWTRVPGVSRNRSLEAHLRNPGRRAWLAARTPNRELWRDHAVNDTLLMLRVDRCPAGGGCEPWGAFSTFAIHSTVNPSASDLFDGDIHAVVQRGLERHMDGRLGRGGGFESATFHVVANGAEGDISPAWPDPIPDGERPEAVETRCERYLVFRTGRRPGGPRTPPALERWRFEEPELERCLDRVRPEVERIGREIVERAADLYDRLGSRLSSDLEIGRAVRTLELPGLGPPAASGDRAPSPTALDARLRGSEGPKLCEKPIVGTASAAGAEDGRSRLSGWRLFGLFRLGLEEGGRARNHGADGCQRPKRVLGGPLQLLELTERSRIGSFPLPQGAHVGVLRIGGVAFAAIPAEATTEAGRRIKQAILAAEIPGVERAGVLGLTNGYLQYLATAEEYAQQMYEGASTLYGPSSEAVLRAHFADLARRLREGRASEALAEIPGSRGPVRSYFAEPEGAAAGSFARAFRDPACDGRSLSARWRDVHPGRLRVEGRSFVEIWRVSTTAQLVGWDDRWDVEVRGLGAVGDRFEWEVRWFSPLAGERYRVVLPARAGFDRAEVTIECPGPAASGHDAGRE